MSGYGTFFALLKYHVAACISNVRWRFVPPVYLVAFISFIVDKQRDSIWHKKLADDSNVWDVALWFLGQNFNEGFLVLLGFILLVGDDIVRGSKDGTLRSTLLLSRSRLRWWGAKVVSIGVLVLAYMSIVIVSMLVASLIMGVPMGLHTSDAAKGLVNASGPGRWYDLPPGWSTLGYTAFTVFSLAFTMWVITIVHQALALFVFPNGRIPFVIFFGWLILGFVIQANAAFWDVRFLLYPGKCFEDFGQGYVSMPVFFGMMTLVLAAATTVGYRRLRKMDF